MPAPRNHCAHWLSSHMQLATPQQDTCYSAADPTHLGEKKEVTDLCDQKNKIK